MNSNNNNDTLPMYSGVGPTHFTSRGVVYVILYSFAVVVSSLGYFIMKRVDAVAEQAKKEEQAQASQNAGRESRTIVSKNVSLSPSSLPRPVTA